ncbi:MAG TPA: putative sulfate/molybdate transporter [Desulfobacterales bacterium]|nr:putative sulfate/molybdate transporter [Desulfobacterales bacterium]
MSPRYRFDRLEIAGSLGDLGTLLPIAIGMILINGLDPTGMFFSIGIFYILSGIYYGITVPVQPMKVIGAYAIATAMTPSQILASGALLGLFLLIIGGTNAITFIGKYTPKPVVRGVQISTGTLLMAQGVKFMIGSSKFQVMRQLAEPYLTIQHIGPVQVGIVIGIIGGVLTLLLLENRKFPAGLVVILGGIFLGLILGTHEGFDKLKIGIYFPKWLPFGFPTGIDFTFAFFALALPQLPMTIGNAVVANADLSYEYFGDDSKKVTYRSLTLSMALANLLSFVVGGMPLCHGAGGLAAHYRFGARTAGSNLMIGIVFLALAFFLGIHALAVVYLLPMAILGVLLIFAGGQLALTIIDMETRKDLFVALLMLGITLASNLAVGFLVGIIVAYVLKSEKLNI